MDPVPLSEETPTLSSTPESQQAVLLSEDSPNKFPRWILLLAVLVIGFGVYYFFSHRYNSYLPQNTTSVAPTSWQSFQPAKLSHNFSILYPNDFSVTINDDLLVMLSNGDHGVIRIAPNPGSSFRDISGQGKIIQDTTYTLNGLPARRIISLFDAGTVRDYLLTTQVLNGDTVWDIRFERPGDASNYDTTDLQTDLNPYFMVLNSFHPL